MYCKTKSILYSFTYLIELLLSVLFSRYLRIYFLNFVKSPLRKDALKQIFIYKCHPLPVHKDGVFCIPHQQTRLGYRWLTSTMCGNFVRMISSYGIWYKRWIYQRLEFFFKAKSDCSQQRLRKKKIWKSIDFVL